jgi:hypothetical protein
LSGLRRDPRQALSHQRSKEFSHVGSKEFPMLDVILISLGLGFFVLSIGYVILCDRL